MFIYYRGLLVGAKIIILMDNGQLIMDNEEWTGNIKNG